MTLALTVIDDQYAGNDGTGAKTIRFTGSFTNPYTAGGERITVSTYFPKKFLGGSPAAAISQQVPIDLAGIGASAKFRGDTASTSVVLLQLFNSGLPGTAAAGRWVDNSVADISTLTTTGYMVGY